MSVLDSPLRVSLSEQSAQLRTDLKVFERDFFVANSRKPGKEDIKQNQIIAQKYKDYNKVRDILSGKLSAAALDTSSPTQDRKRKRSRHDDGQQEKPPRTTGDRKAAYTPRKEFRTLRPDELDPYDAPPSASPRPQITELGPTPQRDGRVLGIFDLLGASGSKRGSSGKKQKEKGLFDEEHVIQSPSTSRLAITSPSESVTPAKRKPSGDTLDHLAGTPMTGGNRNRARTPASSAKKFMLNQFFATPSAIRYATMLQSTDADGNSASSTPEKKTALAKTPLLDRVLGRTPSKPVTCEDIAGDQTPAYLKRSFSFKQRLLSASTGTSRRNSLDGSQEPSKLIENQIQRIAPSQRRKGKYNPRTLSQIAQDIKTREAEERHATKTARSQAEGEYAADDDDADDDEWEALREIEVNDTAGDDGFGEVLPHDSQTLQNGADEPPTRKWKKKGQKRSTRRAVMRPSRVGVQDPRYRKQIDQSEDEGSDVPAKLDGNEDKLVEETQFARPMPATDDDIPSFPDDELLAAAFASDGELASLSPVKKQKAVTKVDRAASKAKGKKQFDDEWEDLPARKINPNAQSHMNFRTLKIKNKNSKAKGGKKFGGRGRR